MDTYDCFCPFCFPSAFMYRRAHPTKLITSCVRCGFAASFDDKHNMSSRCQVFNIPFSTLLHSDEDDNITYGILRLIINSNQQTVDAYMSITAAILRHPGLDVADTTTWGDTYLHLLMRVKHDTRDTLVKTLLTYHPEINVLHQNSIGWTSYAYLTCQKDIERDYKMTDATLTQLVAKTGSTVTDHRYWHVDLHPHLGFPGEYLLTLILLCCQRADLLLPEEMMFRIFSYLPMNTFFLNCILGTKY